MWASDSRLNWNLECWFFEERGKKPEDPEKKNPRSKDENQQQNQPTYGAGSGNRTQATLVGGYALTTVPSLLPQTLATTDREQQDPENKVSVTFLHDKTSMFSKFV